MDCSYNLSSIKRHSKAQGNTLSRMSFLSTLTNEQLRNLYATNPVVRDIVNPEIGPDIVRNRYFQLQRDASTEQRLLESIQRQLQRFDNYRQQYMPPRVQHIVDDNSNEPIQQALRSYVVEDQNAPLLPNGERPTIREYPHGSVFVGLPFESVTLNLFRANGSIQQIGRIENMWRMATTQPQESDFSEQEVRQIM